LRLNAEKESGFMKSTGYDHVQRGILQAILLWLAAVCLMIAFFMKHSPPYLIIFIAAGGVSVLLSFAHAYLAVKDNGDHLSVQFGPIPIFRKNPVFGNHACEKGSGGCFLLGNSSDAQGMVVEYQRI
jgi:hypothetical protein